MTIASAFNDIAVAQGGTPSTSGTIAGAIDALNDALAGSDQQSAQTIEDAVRLLGQNIGGGSSVTVEALTATENKTYTAPEGKAYSPVTVNVSGGGSTPHTISCFSTDESFNLTPFNGDVQSAAINEEAGECGPSGTEINTANTGDIVYASAKNGYSIVGYMITIEDTPFIQTFDTPVDEIGIFMPDADLSIIYADMN